MDDDQVSRSIAALEEGLLLDDPGLDRRLDRLARADSVLVRVAFGLLATGAVLFVSGLARGSYPIAIAGVVSFVLAVGSDAAFKRLLRRH